MRRLVVEKPVQSDQSLIEEPLMPLILDDRRQELGRQRRYIEVVQLVGRHPRDKRPQAGLLDRDEGLGQHAQRETRERRASLVVGEPLGAERREIHRRELLRDRAGRKKLSLDEVPETLGDPLPVARDDRSVGKPDAEGVAKERHDRVPVRKAADRRGLRPRGDIGEARMIGLQEPGDDGDQDARGEQGGCDDLDAQQVSRALCVGRSSDVRKRGDRAAC